MSIGRNGSAKAAWPMADEVSRRGRPRRLTVIYNPAAGDRGRGRRFAQVIAELERLGCQVVVQPTAARGDAERFARAAGSAATDAVVAAGGDGTINEVINGLDGSGLPLGVIPLGTANVFAAEV